MMSIAWQKETGTRRHIQKKSKKTHGETKTERERESQSQKRGPDLPEGIPAAGDKTQTTARRQLPTDKKVSVAPKKTRSIKLDFKLLMSEI